MGEKTRVKTVSTRPSLIMLWVGLCAFFCLAVLSALIPLARASEVDDIETVALVGTFQVDLGCPYNWDPSCTQTFLQDVDGNGVYEFSTRQLPRGTYECRVVINEDWGESYGKEADRDGANIVFQVTEEGGLVTLTYDSLTHILSVREHTTATASTPCQSNQECQDKLGSDWTCDSGLCVRISENHDNTVFFCGFSSFLGNNHPALDSLRRFRDEVLKKYTFGRRLINVYYRNQYKVFSFIERHPVLKKCAVRLIESFAQVLEFFLDGREASSRLPD
ncbi:MAG TPA: hypothetical protein VES58_09160 [Syntrophobacteria bacterium]|nr:hypothetical protein [Syntrophobacteria bacterium]